MYVLRVYSKVSLIQREGKALNPSMSNMKYIYKGNHTKLLSTHNRSQFSSWIVRSRKSKEILINMFYYI